jgi:polyhydroxybutyrate depolymerase
MGSAMTFALACAPQRTFAAFGGVALTLYEPQCEQSPPAPIIYFHGTRDQVVRFGGGQPANEDVTLPSVPAAMRDWAQHNECTVTQTTDVAKDVRLREWTGCADDVEVDYYRVRGGGHTWPGTSPFIADAVEQSLGKTTQSVNASRLMWEFFQEYSLPTA